MTAEPVLVSPEEFARTFNARNALALRARVVGSDVATVARVTRTVACHDRTRAVARNLAYIPGGAWVVFKHWRETHTNARYERMIRTAEQCANWDHVLEWETRAELARDRRHKRVMDWIRAPLVLVKAAALILAAIVVALLLLGWFLHWATNGAVSLVGPIVVLAGVIAWVVFFVGVAGPALLVGAVALGVATLWWVGRQRAPIPQWLESTEEARDDSISQPGVAAALAHLGIAPLNKAIKDGWQVEFLMPPTLVNGRGYQVVFSIPMGVTAGMIADKRPVLARNLIRADLEVWPTAHERSGYVDMWVAHPGATQRIATPYPLLHEGTADVFAGVPIGESQRGDVIMLPLMEASMGLGGMPGTGKSNAARIVMAGAAVDPLSICRAYVFAGNGDFDAFEPRLDRYRHGTDESVVVDAVAELRELYAEVGRREHRLAELSAKKLSREMASRYADMRPIVAVFSECHELFSHPDLGKEAADLATQTVKRMRKCGIFLVFDTQSSRAEAIPPKLVELFKYNACFAVKTWRSNDGFLGDGSFQAGIRATELRPGKDRGTSLLTGATEERFEIVRWFYLEANDDTGFDAATEIIARAAKTMKPGLSPRAPATVERDLLDDVYGLVGDEERCRASEMAVMLRRIAPDYRPYINLDGVKLAEMLSELGVPVRPHKGYPKFSAAAVLAARDRRGE